MSESVAFPSGVSRESRSMPASMNAWSVGANTVNGPGPCNVESSSAWMTPATRESWTPVHCAVLGISRGESVGIRTLSITWIKPLLEITSVRVTFASLTMTESPTENDNCWPFAASASIQSETFIAGTSAETTW